MNTDMNIIIREIEEKDYPDVKALLINELWENKGDGDYIIPFFEKTKADEDYITFVALADNIVIGIISSVTFHWAWSERKNMIVQGIAVKTEYQNKGIGKKLLEYNEAYAESNGIIGIGLCSGFHCTAAHAFYEHNGYTKLTQYFGKNFK